MPTQTYEIEIDRSQLSDDAFSMIRNDLVKDLVKEAWIPDETVGDPHAWHVKAEFDKHVKGGISVGGYETPGDWVFDPDVFDPGSLKIERLKISLDDIENLE